MAKNTALLEKVSSSDLVKKQYVLTLPRLVWLLCQEALRREEKQGQDDQRTLNSTGVRRLEACARREGFPVSRTPLMNILGPYRKTMDGELSPVRPPRNPHRTTLAAIAHMTQKWEVRDPEDPSGDRLIFKTPGDVLNLHHSTYYVWLEGIQQEGERQPVLLSPRIREIAMLMEALEEGSVEEVYRQVMDLMPGKLSLLDKIFNLPQSEQAKLAAKILGSIYSMLPERRLTRIDDLPEIPLEAIAALKKKRLPPKPVMQVFLSWSQKYSTEVFNTLELWVNAQKKEEVVNRRVVDIVASAMTQDNLNPQSAEDIAIFLAHGPELDELENSVITCILTGAEIPQDAYSVIADALSAYGIETTAEKLTLMSENVSHV